MAPSREERLDSEYERMIQVGLDLDDLKDQWFYTWRDAIDAAERLFRLAEREGSPAGLLLLMRTKGEDEQAAEEQKALIELLEGAESEHLLKRDVASKWCANSGRNEHQFHKRLARLPEDLRALYEKLPERRRQSKGK